MKAVVQLPKQEAHNPKDNHNGDICWVVVECVNTCHG